ncbi:MAG: hypothetical protein K0U66_01680 [Gammaproteobacteria bacterium]|nr:hypothetical protein [Gammaproteobacteria bacterium]
MTTSRARRAGCIGNTGYRRIAACSRSSTRGARPSTSARTSAAGHHALATSRAGCHASAGSRCSHSTNHSTNRASRATRIAATSRALADADASALATATAHSALAIATASNALACASACALAGACACARSALAIATTTSDLACTSATATSALAGDLACTTSALATATSASTIATATATATGSASAIYWVALGTSRTRIGATSPTSIAARAPRGTDGIRRSTDPRRLSRLNQSTHILYASVKVNNNLTQTRLHAFLRIPRLLSQLTQLSRFVLHQIQSLQNANQRIAVNQVLHLPDMVRKRTHRLSQLRVSRLQRLNTLLQLINLTPLLASPISLRSHHPRQRPRRQRPYNQLSSIKSHLFHGHTEMRLNQVNQLKQTTRQQRPTRYYPRISQ